MRFTSVCLVYSWNIWPPRSPQEMLCSTSRSMQCNTGGFELSHRPDWDRSDPCLVTWRKGNAVQSVLGSDWLLRSSMQVAWACGRQWTTNRLMPRTTPPTRSWSASWSLPRRARASAPSHARGRGPAPTANHVSHQPGAKQSEHGVDTDFVLSVHTLSVE